MFLKHILIVFLVALCLTHSSAQDAISSRHYTCVMHPEVIADAPGKCPKCGMTLVPMTKHEHEGKHEMTMHSSINLAEPMSRESSGTAWVPDSSPTYGYMQMFGDDMLMLHGAAWPRYVNASTRRGDDRIDMPNWFMAMYSHPFSDQAQLGLRGMMSLDPLTEDLE